VRAIRNGNFKIKEELPERNYDLWGGGAAEVQSKVQPPPSLGICIIIVVIGIVVTPLPDGPPY